MQDATPARRRPGRPPVLTREAIVATASSIIDREGAEALTMRRLGSELGVAAMSLYRHVPHRRALLTAVVGEHFRLVMAALDPGPTWAETLGRFAHGYRRVLLDHPRAVPLLATHPVDQQVGAAGLQDVLAQFMAAGVPAHRALLAVQSVAVFVLGHALAEVGGPDDGSPGDGADPHPGAAADWFDDWFETGVRALVAGFRQEFAADAPR